MSILKKVLFALFTFTVSFSILGCGYKPATYYAKEEISGKVFLKVTIDLEDPQNSVLIKDEINKLLIQKLDADLVDKESLADTVMNVVVNSVSMQSLQYDKSGYNKLYRAVVVINVSYFKKSDTAKQFFAIVRNVFENWDEYKAILKCNPQEEVSTDWAYALACHIIGVEKTMLPKFDELSMVHMKQFVNEIPSEDWTNTLVYELLPDTIRINTYPQYYPFHYHVKSFSDKILESYKWNT